MKPKPRFIKKRLLMLLFTGKKIDKDMAATLSFTHNIAQYISLLRQEGWGIVTLEAVSKTGTRYGRYYLPKSARK